MTKQPVSIHPLPLVTENAPHDKTAAPRSRAKIVLPAFLALAALVGGVRYLFTYGREETDDAQIEGRIANVSPRVAGQVVKILVQDNQLVHAGDVVVELDRADLDTKLEVAQADMLSAEAELAAARAELLLVAATTEANLRKAKAGVVQAASGISSSNAAIEQARADVAAAEARFKFTETDLGRVRQLTAHGALPSEDLDVRQAAHEQARAALDQARARVASAQAGLEYSLGGVDSAQGLLMVARAGPVQKQAAEAAVQVAEARLQQARAAVSLARQAASYTQVRALLTGQVSRRSVEVGQMVSPERPLMTIVPQDDLWVVANFKEDQVGDMRPGQPVDVTVDAFPGRHFKGHVDSLAGASGARFSLLPPDNATGNFVKVVQRIPVLVRFSEELGGVPIKPGMSATVTVDTRGR